MGRVALAFALALGLTSTPRSASAQATAPVITDNRYTLQFHQGPVTTATRIIGLGGAYAALAEYTEGVYANSAASAVRVPWSVSRFDYDLSPSITVPGAFQNTDFENRGRVGTTNRFDNSLNVGFGFQAQYGAFGATLALDYNSFDLREAGARTRSGQIGLHRGITSIGYALLEGQLLVGVGLRGAFLGVADGIPNFGSVGVGGHFGGIYAPAGLPLRLGASYRDAVEVTKIRGVETRADGAEVAVGRILPDRAVLPWEVQLGLMLGLGGYPGNNKWIDPDDDEAPLRARLESARLERAAAYSQQVSSAEPGARGALLARLEAEERALRAQEDATLRQNFRWLERKRAARWESWSRRGVMLVGDLLLTGPSSRPSIGIEDFLDQRVVPFGQTLTVSPRLGVETELVPHYVKVRTGTYVEPSRFEEGAPRQHFTAGVDFRLFVFNPLGLLSAAPMRLRLVADVAPRYTNYGFALGTWH